MKHIKRLFSLLAVLAMTLPLFPAALAAQEGANLPAAESGSDNFIPYLCGAIAAALIVLVISAVRSKKPR